MTQTESCHPWAAATLHLVFNFHNVVSLPALLLYLSRLRCWMAVADIGQYRYIMDSQSKENHSMFHPKTESQCTARNNLFPIKGAYPILLRIFIWTGCQFRPNISYTSWKDVFCCLFCILVVAWLIFNTWLILQLCHEQCCSIFYNFCIWKISFLTSKFITIAEFSPFLVPM